MPEFARRLEQPDDLDALHTLMHRAIVTREPALLDPAVDAAKIRAMYTHPEFVRRGIGRAVLELCETAARAGGFGRVEMMATLAGEKLYRAHGYRPIEAIESDPIDGVRVPLLRMEKRFQDQDH